ncbi:Homeobox-leucine zipper protein HDG12 [Hirschfeldia incana]|nr:Homeobox-leucine zipper protein HDG12 [Hirschfeldia incana]
MEFLGDSSETDKKKMKKRFHRHTPHQIHRLESSFNECQHPDEKQRLQLSKELGLAPRQIKFWFQNRRTQKKAQHERADNCALKEENDRIRCENIAIREAIKRAICLTCGDAPVHEDSYFDEQKLRIENAHLREELERVSNIAARFMGRPLPHLPPLLNPMRVSPSELFHSGPSLDFDLLPGSSSSSMALPTLPSQPNLVLSDMDKSLVTNIAVTSMEELLRLTQTNEPLWIKTNGGRDVLNLQSYEITFPRSSSLGGKNHNLRKEATRSSGVVFTNAMTLVDMLMDSVKSSELFSSIVASSKTLAVISSGMRGSHGDSLHLMLEELQVLSPLVPTREFSVLRYCQQIEHGTWAIVNVSYELPQFISHSRSYKFPSGCLVQDLSNGYSKVTWVEHVEVEEQEPMHKMFKDNVREGLAFGAERWIATLQRMYERFTAATSSHDLKGVIPSPEGKQSIMKLAQRMVSNFCLSVGTSNNTRSKVVSGLDAFGIRVTSYKSQHEPNGMVLCAATSFWLPVSPQNVFNFLKDERTRPQWDVLLDGNSVQEVAHIANGSHPGNCISVLRGFNASSSQNHMLILQESCVDSSGSLVVYTPVDLTALNMAMTGQDTSYIPILPSGFAVLPDGGRNNQTAEIKAEGGGGGSLITVGFQIMVSSLQSGKLNMESMETVNNLISTTVHQIKTTLNSPSTA